MKAGTWHEHCESGTTQVELLKGSAVALLVPGSSLHFGCRPLDVSITLPVAVGGVGSGNPTI